MEGFVQLLDPIQIQVVEAFPYGLADVVQITPVLYQSAGNPGVYYGGFTPGSMAGVHASCYLYDGINEHHGASLLAALVNAVQTLNTNLTTLTNEYNAYVAAHP
jgi:hypothetical protein